MKKTNSEIFCPENIQHWQPESPLILQQKIQCRRILRHLFETQDATTVKSIAEIYIRTQNPINLFLEYQACIEDIQTAIVKDASHLYYRLPLKFEDDIKRLDISNKNPEKLKFKLKTEFKIENVYSTTRFVPILSGITLEDADLVEYMAKPDYENFKARTDLANHVIESIDNSGSYTPFDYSLIDSYYQMIPVNDYDELHDKKKNTSICTPLIDINSEETDLNIGLDSYYAHLKINIDSTPENYRSALSNLLKKYKKSRSKFNYKPGSKGLDPETQYVTDYSPHDAKEGTNIENKKGINSLIFEKNKDIEYKYNFIYITADMRDPDIIQKVMDYHRNLRRTRYTTINSKSSLKILDEYCHNDYLLLWDLLLFYKLSSEVKSVNSLADDFFHTLEQVNEREETIQHDTIRKHITGRKNQDKLFDIVTSGATKFVNVFINRLFFQHWAAEYKHNMRFSNTFYNSMTIQI